MFFIHTTFTAFIRQTLGAIVLCLFATLSVSAQQQQADTANKIKIIIANTGAIEHFKTDSGSFNKFITDVVVYQGTDTLYCDSLFQFIESKKLEAFGDVRIAQQGGTEATCNFLRYTSDKKLAFMTGNVGLTDGKNRLVCEELTYDLGTKTGVYNHNGTLTSDSTTVSSISGVYNVHAHEARFTGNVNVLDPRYKIASKDLGYNTVTKVETFYDYSVVTSDSGKSVLTTWKGTYDSKNVIARFTGHSSIWNDGQYIEADSMHYDKPTGYGFAIGNVISIDTTQHTTLYCGRADFFRKQRVLWAIIKPVMELATGKDTFYMRADTFYSAPMVRVKGKQFRMPVDSSDIVRDTAVIAKATPADSIGLHGGMPASARKRTSDTSLADGKKGRGTKQRPIADTTLAGLKPAEKVIDSMWAIPPEKYRLADFIRDTVSIAPAVPVKAGRHKKKQDEEVAEKPVVDTAAPVFFSGYHNVRIFSDSMQAKCDSVTFTRSDSIVRLIYAPIAWSRGSQITGDTILMQLDTNGIRSMYIPDNSFMASRSGPIQAAIFDQVQGKTLTAFFKNNALRSMIVSPDAQSIYYSKDDAGAYVGVNEANSVLMRFFFGEEKISKIKFEKDVKQTMTPMDKADLPNTKLSRFKWLYDERPASKEELFR
jgi:lipopolysaccharide export system protein LptA